MNVTYKKITDSSNVKLFSGPELKTTRINAINICNIDAIETIRVNLYLEKTVYAYASELDSEGKQNSSDTTTTYSILKSTPIPIGATLQLDSSDICIDYTSNDCKLYFSSSHASGKIDLIIKTTGTSSTQNNY
jgi:dihydrodipicolinate reductase